MYLFMEKMKMEEFLIDQWPRELNDVLYPGITDAWEGIHLVH
jgi:hypothetical protein